MWFFKNYGLLGQNARNLNYMKSENFDVSRKLADSKLKTKQFLLSHKVATPETLATFSKHEDINSENIQALETPFVVKPNNGYGGKGIIVFDSKNAEENFITNTGDIYTPKELKLHLDSILDGFFSLSGTRDTCIIEKKIILTKEIELLGKYGLPDIRVICYNLVPVMAMMRIPTAQSWGKANLHAGACGVGIDIGTGKLTYITKGSKIIKSIPGIGDVRWIELPDWEETLILAVKVQKVTGVQYIGCDIVLDEQKWPLLLEINARAGLEVQVANLAPLKSRLERVEGIDVSSIEKGVRLGRDLFSGDIEEKIQNISGKKVVGSREYLELFYEGKTYNYIAQIRTSQSSNFIDRNFMKDVLKVEQDEIGKIKIDTCLLWVNRSLRFDVKDIEGSSIILWLSALKWFLVDPFKYKKWENPFLPQTSKERGRNTAVTKTYEKQLLEIDKVLWKIEKKLSILKYTTPINLTEEKEKFIQGEWKYIPRFQYWELPFSYENEIKSLQVIEIPDIPMWNIFRRKKREIEEKLLFFKAFMEQNTLEMELHLKNIFGKIEEENFLYSKDILEKKSQIIPEQETLGFSQIESFLTKFNHIYKLKTRLVEEDTISRFTMRGDDLILKSWAIVGKRELRSIIAHEIETHYLRKLNGREQQLSIFSRGTAGYTEIEEGIAICNQSRFISEKDRKYYSIFERYYFLEYARKHSYRRLVTKLVGYYDSDFAKVFDLILRIKRGWKDPSKSWVCLKDVVYVNWYVKVQDFLSKWWNLEDLYIGKISIEDIQDINTSLLVPKPKNFRIPFSL